MHWTYNEEYRPESDLQQGDILEPTEKLIKVFKDVHPYFAQKKYLAFFVLSQSCDMVKRNGKCSATHINLSVVRSLQDVISSSLKDRFGYLAPGIYSESMKRTVDMMVERLVNQNENNLGLFYLHPDADAGIAVHSVAILRVAISLRASEHYETIKDARIGGLSKEFQAKLGWMVGNLFSRIGVRDWKEMQDSESKEKSIINNCLKFTRVSPIWLDKRIYGKIIEEYNNFEKLPTTEQDRIIKDFLPPPPKDKILEIITKTIKDVYPKASPEICNKIKNRLSNNQQLEAQMRKFR
jgi:hypothetical protein